MKPVSYQSMPSSVNGGHPTVSLDRVLTTSNVKYCEKCGFASTDAAVFEKHMVEHMGTRFYCFYCNDVSYSEAELNAHLKRHTSKYPFKCPHCGQGYMRRLCLVKHIDRLHSKSIIQGPAKSGVTKNPQGPVPSALTSLHAADPSLLRPVVRVTIPNASAAAVRLGKDEQRAKTLETNASNVTNGNPERLSPLNGLIQHNRALTVSLPEEVTIPAGCLVELVEVKTVNGTKELKLRLVSQQENESVIKDARTTASQNTALGKPLSSTLINHTNTVRPISMGMSTINRKQCDAKMGNMERPAAVPVSVSSNLQVSSVSKEKSGLKRASPEIINLESNTVIPNKVSKSIISPVREGGNSGIRVTQTAPVSHAAPSPVISSRVTSRLSTTSTLLPNSMVSQRVVDERKPLLQEYPKSIPSRRASDTKNMQDMPVAMKVEPGDICLKSNTSSKTIKEALPLTQDRIKSTSPSMRSPIVPTVQVRPPMCLVSKDNVSNQSFSLTKTLNKPISVKTPVLLNHANSKISAWKQDIRSNVVAKERAVSEPESFPVISSVFSLSQQPEDAQGPIQPLVMALRGIVMDKSSSSVSTTQDEVKITNTEHVDKPPILGQSAQVATKNGSFIHQSLLREQTCEPVKAEDHHQGVHHPPTLTHNHIQVKEETKITLPTDKSSHSPDSKSLTLEESKVTEPAETSESQEPLEQMAKSEQDSKFLTVTLKRVQVGVWKQTKKGLKLRIAKYKTQVPVGSVTDCTVIYPMPLKVDQPVKRPGPNQPVVVLNHPKPRVSAQGMGADSFANTGASEVVPKCQILKMRLSKVMGQKYEVMGCTVRVFP